MAENLVWEQEPLDLDWFRRSGQRSVMTPGILDPHPEGEERLRKILSALGESLGEAIVPPKGEGSALDALLQAPGVAGFPPAALPLAAGAVVSDFSRRFMSKIPKILNKLGPETRTGEEFLKKLSGGVSKGELEYSLPELFKESSKKRNFSPSELLDLVEERPITGQYTLNDVGKESKRVEEAYWKLNLQIASENPSPRNVYSAEQSKHFLDIIRKTPEVNLTYYSPEQYPTYNLSGKITDYNERVLNYMGETKPPFLSPHFQGKFSDFGVNLAAHARSTERPVFLPGENKGLISHHLETVQSDWWDQLVRDEYDRKKLLAAGLDPEEFKHLNHQEIVNKLAVSGKQVDPFFLGYFANDAAPSHPLNGIWSGIMVKDAIVEALQKNADALTFTPSDLQLGRWTGFNKDTARAVYDKRIPNTLREVFPKKEQRLQDFLTPTGNSTNATVKGIILPTGEEREKILKNKMELSSLGMFEEFA